MIFCTRSWRSSCFNSWSLLCKSALLELTSSCARTCIPVQSDASIRFPSNRIRLKPFQRVSNGIQHPFHCISRMPVHHSIVCIQFDSSTCPSKVRFRRVGDRSISDGLAMQEACKTDLSWCHCCWVWLAGRERAEGETLAPPAPRKFFLLSFFLFSSPFFPGTRKIPHPRRREEANQNKPKLNILRQHARSHWQTGAHHRRQRWPRICNCRKNMFCCARCPANSPADILHAPIAPSSISCLPLPSSEHGMKAKKLAEAGAICAINYANNDQRAQQALQQLASSDKHALVKGSPFQRDGARQIVAVSCPINRDCGATFLTKGRPCSMR